MTDYLDSPGDPLEGADFDTTINRNQQKKSQLERKVEAFGNFIKRKCPEYGKIYQIQVISPDIIITTLNDTDGYVRLRFVEDGYQIHSYRPPMCDLDVHLVDRLDAIKWCREEIKGIYDSE